MEWIDYLEVPGATDAEISSEESIVGHRFPDGLKKLLAERQGWCLPDFELELSTGLFADMRCIATCAGRGTYSDIAYLTRVARSAGPGLDYLVCFADTSDNASWCLAYQVSPSMNDKPSIKGPYVIYADRDYEQADPRAFTFVAASFDEFLELVEASFDPGE